MPKESFKGDLAKRKAKYVAQNRRTYANVQKRRTAHDQAHGYPAGTTNSRAKRWTSAPTVAK